MLDVFCKKQLSIGVIIGNLKYQQKKSNFTPSTPQPFEKIPAWPISIPFLQLLSGDYFGYR